MILSLTPVSSARASFPSFPPNPSPFQNQMKGEIEWVFERYSSRAKSGGEDRVWLSCVVALDFPSTILFAGIHQSHESDATRGALGVHVVEAKQHSRSAIPNRPAEFNRPGELLALPGHTGVAQWHQTRKRPASSDQYMGQRRKCYGRREKK